MNSSLLLISLVIVSLVTIRVLGRYPAPMPLYQARRSVDAGQAILIDVRESHDWPLGYAADAVLLPSSDLTGSRKRWKPFLSQNGTRQLLTYSATGASSERVTTLLRKAGFEVHNLGSYDDLIGAGFVTRQPQPSEQCPVGPEI